MTAKLPDVSGPGNGDADFLRGFIRLEIIVLGFGGDVQLLNQILQVIMLESGHGKIVSFQIQLRQGFLQLLQIPLSGDFIKGYGRRVYFSNALSY